MNTTTLTWGSALVAGMLASTGVMAEGLDNLSGDFRLRLETVEQDNAAEDATALTLRSRLTYSSDSYNGFSGKLEVENNTAVIDDYKDTLGKGAQYSVVADPEFTEVDQAYVQYKQDGFSAKVGRQVLTLDNHRFVGHVGWRQDRQTFNALTASYAFSKELEAKLAYINKRGCGCSCTGRDATVDESVAIKKASFAWRESRSRSRSRP